MRPRTAGRKPTEMSREIKFRAFHKKNHTMHEVIGIHWALGFVDVETDADEESTYDLEDMELVGYTGLKDKNGLTDIYEGDIIDEQGEVIGNVYEGSSDKYGTNLLIGNMGTTEWRGTEQAAMERGCRYAQ